MITPVFLFASDDPETVPSPGRLMTANVNSATPCRLYFDHVNGSMSELRLAIVASNTGRSAARLSISQGYAGPAYDYMLVGHDATKRFLINRDTQGPTHVAVGPGSAVALFETDFGPRQCVCGIADIASDQVDDVDLIVLALDGQQDPCATFASAPNCPPDRFGRKGKFDISGVPDIDVAFAVGNAHTDFRIGTGSFPNQLADPLVADPQPLQGDYAIVRHASIALTNPLTSDAVVALTMSPRGGSATGTYRIDGTWYDHGRVDAGNFYRLASYPVAAGTEVAVDLVTAAELNSSYPVLFRIDIDRSGAIALTLNRF